MKGAKTFVTSIAIALCMIAVVVLAGWQLNMPALKSFLSKDMVPMVANSAICFLSGGVILFLSTFSSSKSGHLAISTLSSLIALIGALTVFEYLVGVNLGIDQMIFDQPSFAGDHPGRMSIITAFNFVVVGMSLLIDVQNWDPKKNIGQYAMLLIFFTTLYPFAGTIFGAIHISSLNTTMSMPSAVCFFLITAAYFARHRTKGWASLLFTDQVAGVLIRRIMIPMVILYPVVAFLTVLGEKEGLYNTEGGTVFMMVSTLALFTVIVLITAQMISRLDDEKEQFKKFFALSSEVLMIASTNGSIKLVSNAFTKVLGYSSQEGVNQSFFHFIHPEDAGSAKELFDRIPKDPKPGSFQIQMKNKDGNARHFLWSYTSDQKTGHLYAAGYDITEIKEAQQVRELARKLTHQNEQLASFAHIVSHNLRSHVGNLNSLLHLHKVAEHEEKGVLFGMFEKVSQHLSSTLNDLIESLRIKEDISKERHLIYFEQVLTKTKEILSSQILESQATIVSDFKIESIAYPGVYLESIFLNLISNAIKYRSPARPLQINLTSALIDHGLTLTAEDNGQGIDMARYGDKLFGFYKTFHESKDAKGIGLFITRTQIEAMGGSIHAESEVDRGTKFKVILTRNNRTQPTPLETK